MPKDAIGPWSHRPSGGGGYRVWDEAGIACIADVHPGVLPDPTGEAHARLIAAAPKMLAACEETTTKYNELVEEMDPDYAAFFTALGPEIAIIKAAIAEATGRPGTRTGSAPPGGSGPA